MRGNSHRKLALHDSLRQLPTEKAARWGTTVIVDLEYFNSNKTLRSCNVYVEIAENGTVQQNIFNIPSDGKERQGSCEIPSGISGRIV
jgi:hypothetical protein